MANVANTVAAEINKRSKGIRILTPAVLLLQRLHRSS